MRKTFITLCLCLGVMFMMSSCYTYTFMEGNGPQTGVKITEKNHYFVYGLAQGKQSDIKQMAGGATDYQVTIQHTFIDGLINSLTFGLYTPTTTTVTK